MNTLLKVALVSESIFGRNTEANTSVICKTNESGLVLSRFFNCFNMPEPSPFGIQFHIEVENAPVYDLDSEFQISSDIDEDNPFLLDEFKNTWIWHNVNEHLYSKEAV